MTTPTADALGRSPFPPIADYAFLSDCETTALVAPSGSIEWMCLPRMDSPSVFGAILDRDAGYFRVGPEGVGVPSARRYVPGTLVLETTWSAPGGWLMVTDALLMGPWHHETERSATHRRAPTDYDADHVLLRMVRCTQGEVQVRMDCRPVFDNGGAEASWKYAGDGYHAAIARGEGGDLPLRMNTDLNIGFEGSIATARTLLKQGDERFVVLSWSKHEPPATAAEAQRRLTWTSHHWRHWLDRGSFPDHPWRGFLERSALTLKGLTFAPTGAIVAAATTSLPETPGGERNWDYRYAWIRDSTFTLWALYTLRFDWEANDFFNFVADVADAAGGKVQIMYRIDGESVIDENILEHLSGYENARPVRVGNAAYTQEQHDVWGAVVGSVWLYTRTRDRLDDRLWGIVKTQVDEALERWRDPDRGIWEVRGEPKHFTYSKVACWMAADRGARLAELRHETDLAKKWLAAAEEIKADVLAHGVDKRGVFTQHYDTEALDASALMFGLVGFLPADDPRVRATVLAIGEELTEQDLVKRYLVDETDDGLSGEEGTFTICSFWMVAALVQIGEFDRAKALCEKLLSHASTLHLYAEELDARTGRHLGNFPQAFTHLALIMAAMLVIRAEQDPRRRFNLG